jgi:hypothetical protein
MRVIVFPTRPLLAMILTIAFAEFATARAGSEATETAETPSDRFAQTTTRQWCEDLQFLARELPKRHANAFHRMPREVFEAEVANLDRRMDSLNGDEIYVGLERIVNLVGDGHTFVEFPEDVARLPLQIRQFGDEYRVTAVTPVLKNPLSARVLRIHDTSVARARELLLTNDPAERNTLSGTSTHRTILDSGNRAARLSDHSGSSRRKVRLGGRCWARIRR